jgi:hypothetical protein
MSVQDLDQGHQVVVPVVDASLSEYIEEHVLVDHIEGLAQVEEQDHLLALVLLAVQLQHRVGDVGIGALAALEALLVSSGGEKVMMPVVLDSIQYCLLHVLGDVEADSYRPDLVVGGFCRPFNF